MLLAPNDSPSCSHRPPRGKCKLFEFTRRVIVESPNKAAQKLVHLTSNLLHLAVNISLIIELILNTLISTIPEELGNSYEELLSSL